VATYADQTWLIIDYLVRERKLTRIASFYQDDEYGLDGHLAGKARLKHYGLEYIAEVDYKRADIDFSSQAAKLKESGAEAVILQAVYREPPRLAEQCHAMGYNPLFIGPSPIVLEDDRIGRQTCRDVIGVEVWPPPTDPGPFLDQYRADMQKYFPNLVIDMTNLYGIRKLRSSWKRCSARDVTHT
jgi:ABC-type branched-subunit amino acid transport system substrate-binding protein